VFFFRLAAAVPALDLALDRTDAFLDIDDVEHKKFMRDVGQPPHWRLKPALYFQVPGLWLGERRVVSRMRTAFVCSEIDRKYLRRTMLLHNVEVMPNAVQRIVEGPLSTEPNVMFIGAYSYAPNVIAAEYLIREIWPRLRLLKPEAQLLIAGSRPEAIATFEAPPPGVRFLGFVEDLDALYRQVRVMCCPIQAGGGTRIKILEAAGYGIPVVSTKVGAEGLTLVDRDEILLHDDPQQIASACARLLEDDTLALRMGKAAQRRVRAEYGRDAIVQRMTRMLFGTGSSSMIRQQLK
jgi:hypothetical protein